jgi:hypothetical protein
LVIHENRPDPEPIVFAPTFQLREEQEAALQALRDHELGVLVAAPVYMAGRVGNFGRTSVKRTFVPPGLGEHSIQILTELGFDDSDIESLTSDGVVKSGEKLDLSVVGPGYLRPDTDTRVANR